MLISINSILKEICLFFKSRFWRSRYYGNHYHLIVRAIEEIALNIRFRLYSGDYSSNGMSYNDVIALNRYVDTWEKDVEHIKDLILHEFGHLQYNDKRFTDVIKYNNSVIKSPSPIGLKLNSDIIYFTDKNEIRLRLLPLLKKMYDNKWSAEECYERVCKYDDIFDLYSKEVIINWLTYII